MAPEQLLHEPVARHADVFSASVVLWEMLADRQLFPFDVGERFAGPRQTPWSAPSRTAPDWRVARCAGPAGARARSGPSFPDRRGMALELRREGAVAPAVEIARWLADVTAATISSSPKSASGSSSKLRPTVWRTSAPVVAPLVTTVPTVSTIPEGGSRRANRSAAVAGPALRPPSPRSRRSLAVQARAAAHGRAADAPAADRCVPPRRRRRLPPLRRRSVRLAAARARRPLPRQQRRAPPRPKADENRPRHRGKRSEMRPPYTVDADGFKHYDRRCF